MYACQVWRYGGLCCILRRPIYGRASLNTDFHGGGLIQQRHCIQYSAFVQIEPGHVRIRFFPIQNGQLVSDGEDNMSM